MKKHVINLLAVVVAIAASSFTTGVFKTKDGKETITLGQWWNFNGTGGLDMSDPSYYSLDEDNFPDCPPVVGNIYCEIHAQPSLWNPEEPDLTTINAYRMRPLP